MNKKKEGSLFFDSADLYGLSSLLHFLIIAQWLQSDDVKVVWRTSDQFLAIVSVWFQNEMLECECENQSKSCACTHFIHPAVSNDQYENTVTYPSPQCIMLLWTEVLYVL